MSRCHVISGSALTRGGVQKLNKSELTARLREAVQVCGLCTEASCECFADGIDCSTQLCDCLRRGGTRVQMCLNPFGTDSLDPELDNYRRDILQQQQQQQQTQQQLQRS